MSKFLNFREINDKKEFKIINKNNEEAEIVIYADIGPSFWGDGFTAKELSEELKKLPNSIKKINVRLSSFGGDVFEGLAIYNRLKQFKAEITVYIDGIAASIASIIAMAGDKIIMGEGALLMIHKPMSGLYGNSLDFEELIMRLEDVEEQLIGIYKRATNIDRTEIKTMLVNETWMDAKEALDKGFVDEIMEDEDEIKIAASCSKFPWMKNKDLNVSSMSYIKKQIENFKQDAEVLLTR